MGLGPSDGPPSPSLLDPGFADRIGIEERRQAHMDKALRFGGVKDQDRGKSMLHPFLVAGRERYDRVASAIAIEPRDPFVDVDLLKLCMKLPAEQFQDRGWPKIVLRRAMAGLLPEDVRWRVGKEHLGWQFRTALWGTRLAGLNQTASGLMERYVSAGALACAENDALHQSQVEQALAVSYCTCWLIHVNDAI